MALTSEYLQRTRENQKVYRTLAGAFDPSRRRELTVWVPPTARTPTITRPNT